MLEKSVGDMCRKGSLLALYVIRLKIVINSRSHTTFYPLAFAHTRHSCLYYSLPFTLLFTVQLNFPQRLIRPAKPPFHHLPPLKPPR